MGLKQRFVNAATARPHVLLVPVPGHALLRQAVQQRLDEYGWPVAVSPAQADLLVECGPPGPELALRVAVCWEAMPGPRTRVRVNNVDEVEAALLGARAGLRDEEAQQRDAADRSVPEPEVDMTGMDMPGMDMSGMDHGGDGGMDMAGMDHGGMDMAGMDHGGMDMDMDLPGGLTMAGRLEDRDGLRLEGLGLRLGPLLPGWPAGVELQVTLSGDVVTAATAVLLDAAAPDRPAGPGDALALLLAAAGWEQGAVLARRAGGPPAGLARRVRRARLLRWSLRGLPAPGGGDLVAHADALAAGELLPECTLEDLAGAVTGLELDAVGLVVAAYGPALTRQAAHV